MTEFVNRPSSRGARYNGFSGQFFRIFIFCLVVDMCDLVHDVGHRGQPSLTIIHTPSPYLIYRLTDKDGEYGIM